MARYIYTAAEVHSNGETIKLTTPEDADHVYMTFPHVGEMVTSDGKTQYLFAPTGGAFAALTIDPTKQGLGEKPQCNNYNDCAANGSETENPGTGGE